MGMSVYIPSWNHYLVNMDGVLGKEPVAPIIQGLTILSRTGSSFKFPAVQPEPKIRSAHRQRGFLRLFAKSHLAMLAIVCGIEPVVHTKAKIGDLSLRVVFEEAGKKRFFRVSYAVPVGILKVPNVRSRGN